MARIVNPRACPYLGLNLALTVAAKERPGADAHASLTWTELFVRDLPALPLFYHVQGTIFREGFSGLKGEARDGGGGFAFNAQEWDIRYP